MAVANPNPIPAILPSAPPFIARAIQQQLRSGQSVQQSHVSFVNTTQRMVNLYWLNYQGFATFYLPLAPTASAKVNTFRSHPWIFRDRDSGERMHVSHSQIFWPQPYQAPDPRNRGQWIACRKQILIHFPVRTLRETCLWQVLKVLVQKTDSEHATTTLAASSANATTSTAATVDASAVGGGDPTLAVAQAITNLCLPSTIKTDLEQMFAAMSKHRNAAR